MKTNSFGKSDEEDCKSEHYFWIYMFDGKIQLKSKGICAVVISVAAWLCMFGIVIFAEVMAANLTRPNILEFLILNVVSAFWIVFLYQSWTNTGTLQDFLLHLH